MMNDFKITPAKIKGRCLVGSVESQDLPDHFISTASTSVQDGEMLSDFTATAWTLSFPIKYLEQDGFIAAAYLEHLRKSTGEAWLIYGRFCDIRDRRHYLVWPVEQVKTTFAILNWEITNG